MAERILFLLARGRRLNSKPATSVRVRKLRMTGAVTWQTINARRRRIRRISTPAGRAPRDYPQPSPRKQSDLLIGVPAGHQEEIE